ncbi:hypothetical protein [uncultured Methanobrevibacter sp.]|uniref:hypothetical protein n=1 Tax=uncultured Methanobrevibacter sp. TaxID=253161 RepID=UPI0026345707|nr:hypothetical protein [uncultured Methanobrevibacter sp.]
MNKKWIIAVAIALAALLVLIVAYSGSNPQELDNSGETLYFNTSSGHCKLSSFINDVKTRPYYEGYNNDTVKWMESLGEKEVFSSADQIVIMDGLDAQKIPQDPGITDVYIYDIFTGKVIENHELTSKPQTVYYVDNVTFITQEIIANGLA